MQIEVKHPKAVAIAKRGDNCCWDMGDYVLEQVPRSGGRYHDSSRAKLKEIADDLKVNGFDYSPEHLRRLRDISKAFPSGFRNPDATWDAHRIAGSPAVLRKAMASAKLEGKKRIGRNYVKSVKASDDIDDKVARKAEHEAAVRAQRNAELLAKQSNSPDTKRRLLEEAAEYREKAEATKGPPPKREDDTSDEPQKPIEGVKTRLQADLAEIKQRLRKLERDMEPHLGEMSEKYRLGIYQQLLTIADDSRAFATKVKGESRSHLRAVS